MNKRGKQRLMDTNDLMMVTRGKRRWGRQKRGRGSNAWWRKVWLRVVDTRGIRRWCNIELKAHIILLPTISPIYLVKFLKRSFQAWGREEGLEEEQRKEVVLRGVVLGDSHQSDFPHVHGPWRVVGSTKGSSPEPRQTSPCLRHLVCQQGSHSECSWSFSETHIPCVASELWLGENDWILKSSVVLCLLTGQKDFLITKNLSFYGFIKIQLSTNSPSKALLNHSIALLNKSEEHSTSNEKQIEYAINPFFYVNFPWSCVYQYHWDTANFCCRSKSRRADTVTI